MNVCDVRERERKRLARMNVCMCVFPISRFVYFIFRLSYLQSIVQVSWTETVSKAKSKKNIEISRIRFCFFILDLRFVHFKSFSSILPSAMAQSEQKWFFRKRKLFTTHTNRWCNHNNCAISEYVLFLSFSRVLHVFSSLNFVVLCLNL